MQLSEKELLMVSESIMSHTSTIEKLRNFSQACNDHEVKQLIDSHISKMERHKQELVNMVQAGTGTAQYTPQYGMQYGTYQGAAQGQYQQKY